MTSRSFAQLMGVAFVLIGIFGFIPGMKSVPPTGYPDLAISGEYGLLLGLFPVNWLHNFVHLGVGIAAFYGARSRSGARRFAQGLTFFYGTLAVMGLIPLLNTTFRLIPIYGHDVWLHAGTAALAAYFGFGQQADVVETERAYRRAA